MTPKRATNLTARDSPATSGNSQSFRCSSGKSGKLAIRLQSERVAIDVRHGEMNVDCFHLTRILTAHCDWHASIECECVNISTTQVKHNMPLNFCQYLYEILINFHNPFIGHSSMLVEKQESQLTYKKLLFSFFLLFSFTLIVYYLLYCAL